MIGDCRRRGGRDGVVEGRGVRLVVVFSLGSAWGMRISMVMEWVKVMVD
jgi:hypothetical protein